MGRVEHISDEDQNIRVDLDIFRPHSIQGKVCNDHCTVTFIRCIADHFEVRIDNRYFSKSYFCVISMFQVQICKLDLGLVWITSIKHRKGLGTIT